MQKKTAFAIIFFLFSLVLLLSFHMGDPIPGGNKYHLPEPRDIEVNGINFTVTWGFIEDENSSDVKNSVEFLNHTAVAEKRIFHQNDILILNISVYDLGENVDVSLLNDGTYQNKNINGIDGIFKNESVTTSSGFIKNTHPRYYFNYVKDGKVVMIQCDTLRIIYDIVT